MERKRHIRHSFVKDAQISSSMQYFKARTKRTIHSRLRKSENLARLGRGISKPANSAGCLRLSFLPERTVHIQDTSNYMPSIPMATRQYTSSRSSQAFRRGLCSGYTVGSLITGINIFGLNWRVLVHSGCSSQIPLISRSSKIGWIFAVKSTRINAA